MGLQEYALQTPWDADRTEGVVIVDTCVGIPLPMSTGLFADADDASAFIEWAKLDSSERWDRLRLEARAHEWAHLRDALPCPGCNGRTQLELATPRRGTECLVRCACDEVTLTGRAPKASLAVTMWNDAVTEWHAEDEARDGEMDDAAERRAAIADRKYDEWKDRQMEGDEC
jgi:hypothetical protein